MVTPVKDTGAMIAGMAPQRAPGQFVFCTTSEPGLLSQAVASMREDEGMSLILPVEIATEHGFDTAMPMAQITLHVYSALDGVGLTAAVATALAEVGIPCNMVAGHHHDHAFVPVAQADAALACLTALARSA